MARVRHDVRALAAELLGGASGACSSTATTACVLDGLQGHYDDGALVGWRILLVHPSTYAVEQRVISVYEGDEARAHWEHQFAGFTGAGLFAVIPEGLGTLAQLNAALDEALVKARRSVQVALPGYPVDGARYIGARLPWLRSSDDIDRLDRSGSPNLLINDDFAIWPDGYATQSATRKPLGWGQARLLGANTDANQISRLSYVNNLLTVGLEGQRHYAQVQTAITPASFGQHIGTLGGALRGEQVTVRFVCSTSSALSGTGFRVAAADDVGAVTYAAAVAPQDGSIVEVELTHTVDAAARDFHVGLHIGQAGAVNLYHAIAVVGAEIPEQLERYGSVAGYPREPLVAEARDLGDEIAVEAPELGLGESLVVTSRMPWPTLASESDDSDAVAAYGIRGLAAGTVYFLARRRRSGEDMSKWAELATTHGRTWLAAVSRKIERPTPDPVRPVEVRGA